MLYSWQINDYNNLVTTFRNRGFSSLLLYGAKNSGQEKLVNLFIDYLLCQDPIENMPCGKCNSCLVRLQSNHPDLHILAANESEERKTLLIKVEQVREVSDFVMLTTHMALHKIIYIPEVNQLNLSSANALLKILEEPPANCVFILVASNLNRLLPTILSRCLKFQLQLPDYSEALACLNDQQQGHNVEFWLNYFNGEPFYEIPISDEQLALLKNGLLKPSIDNIFLLSSELDPKKIGMVFWLDCLTKWLSDLVKVKLGGANPCFFTSISEEIALLVARINIGKLFSLQDQLVFMTEWAEHPLNHKLQLENLLFRYQQIYV